MAGRLQLENVVKTYGIIKALDSVTLDIEPGLTMAFLGMNGSGKTTLLRILAGLEVPNEGSVRFNSVKMNPQKLRQIATLVFQKTVMFSTSVSHNMGFGLGVRGFDKKEIDKRVSEVLASVGLSGFEKRRAKRLSGGE